MDGVQKMKIPTPLGTLVIMEYHYDGFDGVWIDLQRAGFDYDLPLAQVEYDGISGVMKTRVWSDGLAEDPTHIHEHRNVEEFFLSEALENESQGGTK